MEKIVLPDQQKLPSRSDEKALVSENYRPFFKKSLYVATYSKDDKLQEITVEVDGKFRSLNPKYKLSPESASLKKYFNVNETSGEITKQAALSTELKKQNQITLYVQVMVDKNNTCGETIVLVNIEKDIKPYFKKPMYEVNYDINDNMQKGYVDVADPFKSLNPKYRLSFNDERLKEYFSIDKKTGKFEKIKPLPLELKQLRKILLFVQVRIDGSSKFGETAILINVDYCDKPHFKSSLYEGLYDKSGNFQDISLEVNEVFESLNAKYQLSFKDEIFKDYFSIDKKSGKIKNVKSLTPDLKRKGQIIMHVCAVTDENNKVGETIVLIKIEHEYNKPLFEKSFYETKYDKDDNFEEISLEVAEEYESLNRIFQLLFENQTMKDYFAVEESTGVIKKIKSLTDNLKKTGKVLIRAQVSVEGISSPDEAIVLVDIEQDGDKPFFKKPFYEVNYYKDDRIQEVIVEVNDAFASLNPIYQLTSKDHKLMDYFTIDETSGKIINNKPLTSKLKKKGKIVFNAQVEVDNSDQIGEVPVLINIEQVILQPFFKKSLYEANYNKENKFKELVVEVDEKFANLNPKYQLSAKDDVLNDYFSIDENTGSIVNKKALTAELKKQNKIILHPEVTVDDNNISGETIVMINIDQESVKPFFKKLLYETKYDKEDNLQEITVEVDQAFASLNPEYSLLFKDNNLQKHFSIDETTGEIKQEKRLSSELKKQNKLLFNALVKVDGNDNYGETLISVNIEKDTFKPFFKQLLYEGNYDKEDKFQEIFVEVDDKFASLNPKYSLTFNDDILTEYFSIDEETGKICIENSLTSKMKEQDKILFYAQVSVDGSKNVGKAAVLINVEQEEIEPTFKELLYEGKYDKYDNFEEIVVEVDSSFFLLNPKYQLSIKDEALREYFSINERTGKINKKNPLPPEIKKRDKIVFNAIVTVDGSTKCGETAILVNIEQTVIKPTFKESVYKSYYYANDDFKIVTVQVAEEFENLKPKYQLSFEKIEFSDYFNIEEETGKIYILKPLSPRLKEQEKIVMFAKVTIDGTPNIGETIIFIDILREIPIPIFEKDLYHGAYEKELLYLPDIKLNYKFTDLDPTYSLEFDYDIFREYFKLTDPSATTLLLTGPLTEDICKKFNNIIIIMKVSVDGITQKGSTVIVITIKKDIKSTNPIYKPIPFFKKSLYREMYDRSDHLLMMERIELADEFLTFNAKYSLQLEYDIFKKYFSLEPDTTNIVLTEPLPNHIKDNFHYVIIYVMANVEGLSEEGKTVVIVDIMPKVQPTASQSIASNQALKYFKPIVRKRPLVVKKPEKIEKIEK